MQRSLHVWLSELTRRNTLLALFVVAVCSVSAMWALKNVQVAVTDARASLFSGLLASQAEALKTWSAEKQADTHRWAKDSSIVSLTEALLDRRKLKASLRFRSQDIQAEFLDRISPAVEDLRLAAANIVAPNGTLIASLVPEYVGTRVTGEYLSRLTPAFSGGDVFVGPTRERNRLINWANEFTDASVIWTASPIQSSSGRILAVLCLGRHATGRFAHILGTGRPGDSGETYAFDKNGLLISPSRFESALRQHGLVANDELLLPGIFPLREFKLASPDSPSMLLTKLVHQATSKSRTALTDIQGAVLSPYLNYVGTPVIGVWQWIPSLNLGIAFEMAESEALAPISFVNINLAILVVTLVLTFTMGPLLPPLLWRRLVPLETGDRVGPYRLVRKIGEGGLAEVYEGIHETLKKPVAIKISKSGLHEECEFRLKHEAELLASLNHPGLVSVSDAGTCKDERPYYVMELVEGKPVSQLSSFGSPLPVHIACQVLKQLCVAIQFVHDHGIVHRDINPNNVLVHIDPTGIPSTKIIDFGFATAVSEKGHMRFTREINFMGALGYMPPERLRNPEDIDIRGDIYSIGAIGLFLLTGEEAVPDLESLDKLAGLVSSSLNSVDHAGLTAVIVKAMAMRKARRWTSCSEFGAALERCLLESRNSL